MNSKILTLAVLIFCSINTYGQNEKEEFPTAEVNPSYPSGGMGGFYSFVQTTLKYPEEARVNRVQGKVFVQFVVNEKGELVEEKVYQGIDAELDAEALRIIKLSPDWNPARITKGGAACKARIVLPITFKLESEKELKKKAKMEAKKNKKKQ